PGVGHHAVHDFVRIDARRGRRPERPLPGAYPRLDLACLALGERVQLDAVRAPAAQQLVEAGELGLVARDHGLAAAADAQAALRAVLGEAAVALAREARLEAVGGVVETGVQHAAVAPARVGAGAALLLDHDHARA